MRMMAKDPDDRFADPEDLIRAIGSINATQTAEISHDGLEEVRRRHLRRRRSARRSRRTRLTPQLVTKPARRPTTSYRKNGKKPAQPRVPAREVEVLDDETLPEIREYSPTFLETLIEGLRHGAALFLAAALSFLGVLARFSVPGLVRPIVFLVRLYQIMVAPTLRVQVQSGLPHLLMAQSQRRGILLLTAEGCSLPLLPQGLDPRWLRATGHAWSWIIREGIGRPFNDLARNGLYGDDPQSLVMELKRQGKGGALIEVEDPRLDTLWGDPGVVMLPTAVATQGGLTVTIGKVTYRLPRPGDQVFLSIGPFVNDYRGMVESTAQLQEYVEHVTG